MLNDNTNARRQGWHLLRWLLPASLVALLLTVSVLAERLVTQQPDDWR